METQTSGDDETPGTQETPPMVVTWVYPTERVTQLSSGTLTLGRDACCSVTLGGTNTSRVHASIRSLGPLRVLRDEGSRNGTRCDGRVVQEIPLETGRVLRIGDHVGVVGCAPLHPGPLFANPIPSMIVGPGSRAAWQRLELAAPENLSVVLVGETGTGKEVYAHALHERSGRTGPLIAVNCGALSATLVEAQLFGHVRGAFTGAEQAAPGLFVSADRGTLFLDEVQELPLAQQVKLLRVLEEKAVTPVGGTARRPVDVRVVAASQQPLVERVAAGQFRQDLMARLSGLSIRLPALRERREEIPHLFLTFLRECGGNPSKLRASFIEALCLFDWPQNIRQLAQAARRAVTLFGSVPELGQGALAELVDDMAGRGESASNRSASSELGDPRAPLGTSSRDATFSARRLAWLKRHEAELRELLASIKRHGGNVSAAARELQVPRFRAQRLLTASSQVPREWLEQR